MALFLFLVVLLSSLKLCFALAVLAVKRRFSLVFAYYIERQKRKTTEGCENITGADLPRASTALCIVLIQGLWIG